MTPTDPIPPPVTPEPLSDYQLDLLKRRLVEELATSPSEASVFDRLIAQARAARPWWLWQPIETAPKDGTWILAFGSEAYSTPNRIRSMAWFDEGEWGIGWYDDLGEGRFSPTHRQPLPAPPAQDGGRP